LTILIAEMKASLPQHVEQHQKASIHLEFGCFRSDQFEGYLSFPHRPFSFNQIFVCSAHMGLHVQ
jgi:hypothetical protein